MLYKNAVQCDRCKAVSRQKSRHLAYKIDRFQSVRSYEHRNRLKDFCPNCYATLEFIGKIKDGNEHP